MASTASSWPITRAVKKSRIDLRSSCSLVSRIETGRPETATASPAPGAARYRFSVCSARIAVSLSMSKRRARQSAGAEILACGIERDLGAVGIEVDMRPLIHFGDHVAHQQQRRRRRQRLDGDGLEQAAQRRLDLHQPRRALGVASHHTISRPAAIAGMIWSSMVALWP